MYCINCGKEINDGAKYCPHCGKEVVKNTVAKLVAEEKKTTNYVHCPKCKSEEIISTTTTTGGRDIMGGLLGFLIFGVLGYVISLFNFKVGVVAGLFGLFIFGFKKVASSTQFQCQKCGFRFLPVKDMIAKRRKNGMMGTVIGLVILLAGVTMDMNSKLESIGCVVFGLLILGGGVAMCVDRKLEWRGYDAEDYLEKENKVD